MMPKGDLQQQLASRPREPEAQTRAQEEGYPRRKEFRKGETDRIPDVLDF